MNRELDRRDFLRAAGAAGAAGLAGCLGGNGGGGSDEYTMETDELYLTTGDISTDGLPDGEYVHSVMMGYQDDDGDKFGMELSHVSPGSEGEQAYLTLDTTWADDHEVARKTVSTVPFSEGESSAWEDLYEMPPDNEYNLVGINVHENYREGIEQLPAFTVEWTEFREPNVSSPESEGWGGAAKLSFEEPLEVRVDNGLSIVEAGEGYANEHLPEGQG